MSLNVPNISALAFFGGNFNPPLMSSNMTQELLKWGGGGGGWGHFKSSCVKLELIPAIVGLGYTGLTTVPSLTDASQTIHKFKPPTIRRFLIKRGDSFSHTHTHTHAHMQVHAHTGAGTHTHTHTHAGTHTHTCRYTHTHTCTYQDDRFK